MIGAFTLLGADHAPYVQLYSTRFGFGGVGRDR
jgi:hypothetical protein